MKVILIILGIWCIIGVISFIWAVHKAPTIEEDDDDYSYEAEDWLMKNEPNYLGQGHWIKK